MTTIGVFATIELIYDAYLAEIIMSNDGSFVAIFWVFLKLIAVAAFIYVAINHNDIEARRINFITYTFSQTAEVLLIAIWLVVVWSTFHY